MKPIVEWLQQLRARDVVLTLEGETLKCSAPPGVLTAELREELRERKPELMAFLKASRQATRVAEQGITRVDRRGPLPLSYAQQRLWFLHQLDPASPVYNIGVVLRMQGRLDRVAFERAFRTIVERHEDLRTRFVHVEGAPQVVIDAETSWRLEVMETPQLATASDAEIGQFANGLVQELFDLERGPLFRTQLLVLGEDDYVAVMTMHHIISDGWSIGVLVNEFTQLYPAYAEGREITLAPLAVQYVDFAAWQRKWLEGGELERQLPYWKKQLEGAPPVVVFPPDHKRPQAEMFRGARSKMVAPKELARKLEKLSQSHGVTLFMTLLAAFNVLLARYTGQEDIVVGSPSANRSRAELNPLVGFFVNNLVLRTSLGGDPTFTELLARVREGTLRAYEHQDVPFDRLVQALGVERSLEHSPLFQTMFILQNFPLEELNLAGLRTRAIELEADTARFDLTVEVFPRHGELWMYFDYNSDLYELETMQRIERHYLRLLEAVCANPEQRVAEIPLLSEEERHRLLVEWNRTEAPLPAMCFPERFAQQARATPERVAVLAGERSLTYGELDRRAGEVAAALRRLRAGPETRVAVYLERSVELVAALLGVMRSGAAYIPLDPAYPKARIANILEDAEPLAVLTSRTLMDGLPEEFAGRTRIVCVEEINADIRAGSGAAGRAVQPDDLAYVLFTSGSTGRPKGVEIPHGALLNFLESMRREPGFTAEDVLLAVTTVSFDIAGLELLLPLYTGGRVCVALEPGDPGALLADLDRYRPTVMQATPATWKLLVAAGWKGSQEMKILCGGEALDTDLARSLHVRCESLWNLYGPTETTIWSAVLEVKEIGTSIPVGRPIQNTTFYVLDSRMQSVPLGVAGELWIGGTGLARGYLNRPELTAERFVASPFVAGERLYRTGDLVRYRKDGTLDFFGRMDHQVKFRGFRIELGEIENALRGCPGVRDAVVLLREDHGDKRLVGYVVAHEDELSAATLRETLRATLPEYMVPGAFVVLGEFPRLPNGKLNRAALPAPERPAIGAAAENADAFAAPATELERTVAAAFAGVLESGRVGLDDNFFDLGAHSLQIVRVHDALNRKLQAKVPLVRFFQFPTVRLLSRWIEQQASAGDAWQSRLAAEQRG